MKRRALLATACASVAGIAGCAGFTTGADTPTTSLPTGTTTPRTPLLEYKCPPHPSDKEPVVCSHTVDTDSVPVYLLVSETATESGAPTLTLHNDSATELTFNPYSWSIMEEHPSGWEAVEKRSSGNGRLTVSPDETYSWTFTEVVGFINEQATLDAGTYTASISVPNPDGSDWVRCLALVRLT